jgi:hypothetical protein
VLCCIHPTVPPPLPTARRVSRGAGTQQLKGVVLHCSFMPTVDPSALQSLAELAADYRARDIQVKCELVMW